MISVLQASRGGTIRGKGIDMPKGTDVGRNFRGSEAKKSKVIGKRRQEAFSGRSEKTGNKEGSQDSRARAWSTSKSLRLVQGIASSLRGSKKVSIWSTWLILWLWLRP